MCGKFHLDILFLFEDSDQPVLIFIPVTFFDIDGTFSHFVTSHPLIFAMFALNLWSGPYTDKSDENVDFKLSSDESEESEDENAQPSQKKTRTVDFVIVYRRKVLTVNRSAKLKKFLTNLRNKGFYIEIASFNGDDDIVFLKIHAPREVLLRYADAFSIDLTFQSIVTFREQINIPCKFMETPILSSTPDLEIFRRTRPDYPGRMPKDITSAEKSLIIYKVLHKTPFDNSSQAHGIEALIRKNIVECAYPLHDGPYEWTDEGPLNDRQLLARYWSAMKNVCKVQPLDLIEKYYGPEVAFYFAWLQFYNKMLIPVAIMGTVFFILGSMSFFEGQSLRKRDVCKSEKILCPRCHDEDCKYAFLKSSCFYSQLINLVDNSFTVTFAIIQSIWATIFHRLWQREEAIMRLKWNLQYIEVDMSMRDGYEEKTKHRRISPITGIEEPYVPKTTQCWHYTITVSTILLLALVLLLVIFGIMVYSVTVATFLTKKSPDEIVLEYYISLIAAVSGSAISVTLILAFEFVYEEIAMCLTELENPRTQYEFDNTYTYKCYILAFINNYSIVFYIAFFKGKFYTYPGDEPLWENFGGIGSDLCDAAGCVIDLSIQIFVHLVLKALLFIVIQRAAPNILILFRKLCSKKLKAKATTQHESDYLLNPFYRYRIVGEYMQMITQYGFVTFFIACCPLTPLLALTNNIFEMRVDAWKVTDAYRRPVAFKAATISAWQHIMKITTYIGIATNAFVIAFTSEFVQRETYRWTVDSNLKGYIDSTLSAFNTSDFKSQFASLPNNNTICYYPGYRYPPSHTLKYHRTRDFWLHLATKFIFIVAFEHIAIIITGILAYVIPSVPFSVKEYVRYQKERFKKMRMKSLNEKYLRNRQL